jgi:hypothetical protein
VFVSVTEPPSRNRIHLRKFRSCIGDIIWLRAFHTHHIVDEVGRPRKRQTEITVLPLANRDSERATAAPNKKRGIIILVCGVGGRYASKSTSQLHFQSTVFGSVGGKIISLEQILYYDKPLVLVHP